MAKDRLRLNDYRLEIMSLIKEDGNLPVPCGIPEYAVVIYEGFFDSAQKEIKIYCDKLDNEVFGQGDVISKARQALNRKICIQILTRSQPEEGPFLKFVKESSIAIKRLEKGPAVNFTVVDNKRYRFERNPGERRAVACMNDPRVSAALAESFDLLFQPPDRASGQNSRAVARLVPALFLGVLLYSIFVA